MRALSLVACVVLAAVAILYLMRHKPAPTPEASGVTVQMGPYGARITDNRPEAGAGGCCRG